MIISKSPLRITLAGGGTDLPSYFESFGGRVLSAAIDKFVYIGITKPFDEKIILKYSQMEKVEKVDDVKHPIFRESLRLYKNEYSPIEITSLADVPAGTGLGSSGSFTTALLHALNSFHGISESTIELAEKACRVEIDILGEPVGKQDQFIASFGGLQILNFESANISNVVPLRLTNKIFSNLENGLQLFYTGNARSASRILSDQKEKTLCGNNELIERLHKLKEQSYKVEKLLYSGNLLEYADTLNEHWREKRIRSEGMTNPLIDHLYETAIANGAAGAKVVGAGGGGFLMTYSETPEKLSAAMRKLEVRELEFKFDLEGTREVSF